MNASSSPGSRLKAALKTEKPLQVIGTINAYCAIMAEKVGFKCLYISGAGVSNASFGLPDLGITTLNDVIEDVRRIANITSLPVLVDADTGFGSAFNIARTVREMSKAGAAAIHIEDQVFSKRCGHRPNKALVSKEEMVDRIKAARDAKMDSDFVIMARTDAIASEGISNAISRAKAYVAAGADMIFAEAVTELSQYKEFSKAVNVPILANITEFGQTPLFTLDELKNAGVSLVLYPLSAFRAMNAAALNVYKTIRNAGTQKEIISSMQTRADLYEFLGYENYEKKLDTLFKNSETNKES
jgi:methylisocitrate lyase